MQERSQHLYEFGPFRLDTAERQLLREGRPVSLTPKAFETLVLLVERHGRLVEKDELMKTVWPDSFVEESNLTNNVYALRKTLAEGQNGHSYIETVPKRGYRFTASVRELPYEGEELLLVRRTRTHIVTEEEEKTDDASSAAQLTGRLSLEGRSERRFWTGWRIGFAAAVLCALFLTLFLALYHPWDSRETRKAEASAAGQPALRSIAVLPFKGIGADSENEYLSLGLADALIIRLGNVRQIVVRPTSAVRRYTDENQDPVMIGRQQGVDAVLDGSFQRTNDRLRLTVQLIRVADGATLWTAQFDEKFTDVFSVQDSISERVACDLVARICGEGAALAASRRRPSAEAYEAYLKGRYFWNKRTAEGIRKSLDYFNRAIELDPAYAAAYAGLADSYLLVGGYYITPQKDAIPKAKAAAQKAIEIDDTLAEPHATLGLIAGNYYWDWAEAERQYRRAIELNPNYATAHHWYGEHLAFMGRYDEGLTEIKRAQELDPLSLIISTDVGKVHYIARQYDRAIEQYQKTLEMDPDYDMARTWLAIAYMEKGQYEEAVAEMRKIRNLEDDPGALGFLGYVYGRAGQKDKAQEVLGRLTTLSRRVYVSPALMAIINMGMGEKDEAFRWLDKVFEERAVGVVGLKVDPAFDSLRSDPRFAILLRRAGFSQ